MFDATETTTALPILDRAELAMSAIHHRVRELVEYGGIMPFTENDLTTIVAQWSVGELDFGDLLNVVSQMFAEQYA